MQRHSYYVQPAYNGATDAKRWAWMGEEKCKQSQHSRGYAPVHASLRWYLVFSKANAHCVLKDHKQLHHGVWVIACCYAHGRDINIHRRVYSLHKRVSGASPKNKVTLTKHFFGLNLVHYLADDFTRVKASSIKAASTPTQLSVITDNKHLLQQSSWQGNAQLSRGNVSSGAGVTDLLDSPPLGPCQHVLSPDKMNLSDDIERFSPHTVDLDLGSSLTLISPSTSPSTETRSVEDFGAQYQPQTAESRHSQIECQITQPEPAASTRSDFASFSNASSGRPKIIAYSPRWSLLEVSCASYKEGQVL